MPSLILIFWGTSIMPAGHALWHVPLLIEACNHTVANMACLPHDGLSTQQILIEVLRTGWIQNIRDVGLGLMS